MNLDLVGADAARQLRDSVHVDTTEGLTSLERLLRRRTARRRAALLVAAAVVAATAWMVRPWAGSSDDRYEPLPAPTFVPLGSEYEVIDSEVDGSGTVQVVAALREGLPSVVLVRRAGSPRLRVVWSSPTEHELGRGEHVPWPSAVSWAPDGSQIAVLVAQERGAGTRPSTLVDLTLVTINPDGSGRHVVDRIGTCHCTAGGPSMTWSGDGLTVGIPDGPDRGVHERTMP